MAFSLPRILLAIFFLASGAFGALLKRDNSGLQTSDYTGHSGSIKPYDAGTKGEIDASIYRGKSNVGTLVLTHEPSNKRFVLAVRIVEGDTQTYIKDQQKANKKIDGILYQFALFTSKANDDKSPWTLVKPFGSQSSPETPSPGYGTNLWGFSGHTTDDGLLFAEASIPQNDVFYRIYYATHFIDKSHTKIRGT